MAQVRISSNFGYNPSGGIPGPTAELAGLRRRSPDLRPRCTGPSLELLHLWFFLRSAHSGAQHQTRADPPVSHSRVVRRLPRGHFRHRFEPVRRMLGFRVPVLRRRFVQQSRSVLQPFTASSRLNSRGCHMEVSWQDKQADETYLYAWNK